MSQLLMGAIALAGVLWLLKSYTGASPSKMAKLIKMLGGAAALVAGGLLTIRGRFDVGLPLAVFGLGLMGLMPGMPASLPGRTRKAPGQVSRVRARFVEMELDHDSGVMRGKVLAGSLAGRALESLAAPELGQLWREASADADSRSLLEAYLDRRSPGWREHMQADAAAGPGEGSRTRDKMTHEEAYQILGVEPGASPEAIRAAHRSLMKKLHPDQGGSTYLAARVNQAREVLLGGHR